MAHRSDSRSPPYERRSPGSPDTPLTDIADVSNEGDFGSLLLRVGEKRNIVAKSGPLRAVGGVAGADDTEATHAGATSRLSSLG